MLDRVKKDVPQAKHFLAQWWPLIMAGIMALMAVGATNQRIQAQAEEIVSLRTETHDTPSQIATINAHLVDQDRRLTRVESKIDDLNVPRKSDIDNTRN